MLVRQLTAAAALIFASAADAQSAAKHVALGDGEYAALHAMPALDHYVEAIKLEPNNYEALWKAARSAVDRAAYDESGATQAKLFAIAETYARAAVRVNPADPEGHFNLARALGERALSVGVRQRVKYVTEIREQALACLKIDPKHAGCLHVMGVWNAEVMRVSGFARMIAKNFLGGKVFGTANWAAAQHYMEQSIVFEPLRIAHYVDAGAIYRDLGNKAKAKEMYETALRLPISDYNDRHYKAQAQAALKAL